MNRPLVSVGTAITGYVGAFAAFSLARGDRRVVAYMAVLGVLIAVFVRAHRVAHFTVATQWALAGCGLLHLAGGLLPSPDARAPIFYETWLVPGVVKYDQAAHFTMIAVVTWCCWQFVGAYADPARTPAAARAFVAVLMACGFGALNEGFEFLSALRFDDAYVGGLDNAGWDLVFNAAGAVTAGVYLALSWVPARQEQPALS